jgi:hypothetical protein
MAVGTIAIFNIRVRRIIGKKESEKVKKMVAII